MEYNVFTMYMYRMVHAFTCAGMLPSQYTHVLWHRSCWSCVRLLRLAYPCSTKFQLTYCLPLVCQKLGYIELVKRAAELSMRASVDEVLALPEYSTEGEVQMIGKKFYCFHHSSLVGHYWCTAWLNSKCIPHYSAMLTWYSQHHWYQHHLLSRSCYCTD